MASQTWVVSLDLPPHAHDSTGTNLPLGQQLRWGGRVVSACFVGFGSHLHVGGVCWVRLGQLLLDLVFPWSPQNP